MTLILIIVAACAIAAAWAWLDGPIERRARAKRWAQIKDDPPPDGTWEFESWQTEQDRYRP